MEHGKKLPASNGKTGVFGFCWGGARSSGTPQRSRAQRGRRLRRRRTGSADSTQETTLANVKAPVLGLYAGNYARSTRPCPPPKRR